jgi:hypothetical protein
MADIKQAAKWLMEGRRVRRPHWEDFLGVEFGFADDEQILWHCDHLTDDGEPCELEGDTYEAELADLLAEDWELVEAAQ